MTRSINQITHDLRPMVKTMQALSAATDTLLPKLCTALKISDPEMKDHFETCFSALKTLCECADIAMEYLTEVDAEAEAAGIQRHY
jgi:hypothetical protein